MFLSKTGRSFVNKIVSLIAALCLVTGPTLISAQDAGALFDLLVRKKLITDQEAEEVRAELINVDCCREMEAVGSASF
jgi:hypothetical protein